MQNRPIGLVHNSLNEQRKLRKSILMKTTPPPLFPLSPVMDPDELKEKGGGWCFNQTDGNLT